MCALGPGESSGQRFPVRRLDVTSEDGPACTTVRLPGSIPGRRVGVMGFFSELRVLVRAGGLAGMGVLGRQEVNGACLFFKWMVTGFVCISIVST